jgi:diacylglycerol kinase
VIVISIALVLAFELINSSIEYMIDQLHPDVSPQIKRAKDVAAAAVLVIGLGALAVGGLLIIDWISS